MILFANRLKQLRVKNDLRQRQMSAVLEIDSGLYSKIERGERRAKKEQVLQLACFLHVDEKELLTFWQVDQFSNAVSTDYPIAYDAMQMAFDQYKQLNTKTHGK